MHDDDHAGISAFINRSAAHLDRNALMLAVGALVPLENGRLGRSWKHSEKLRELARYVRNTFERDTAISLLNTLIGNWFWILPRRNRWRTSGNQINSRRMPFLKQQYRGQIRHKITRPTVHKARQGSETVLYQALRP